MSSDVQSIFPLTEVIGNAEKPSYSGCFDIYVWGVGPMHQRD